MWVGMLVWAQLRSLAAGSSGKIIHVFCDPEALLDSI